MTRDFTVEIDDGVDIRIDEVEDLERILKDIEPDEDLFMAYLAGYTYGVRDERDGGDLPFDDVDTFKQHVADRYEMYRKREGIYGDADG